MEAPRPPVRVTLLLASLNTAGEERVAVNLLQGCDRELVDIRMGLIRRAGAFMSEVTPDLVTGPTRWPGWLASRLRAPSTIADIIRTDRPDVVMSFGMGVHLYTWLALGSLGDRKPMWVCREDNNPDAEIGRLIPTTIGRNAFKAVRRRMFRAPDALVAVSADLGAAVFPAVSDRTRVIYNPIDISRVIRSSEAAPSAPFARPFVAAAGRLVEQKGFEFLIKGFAGSREAAQMDLVILGEGDLETSLKALAASLGVGDRVTFPGFQANPWSWFSRARAFVLSSLWEGFGNVVAEAMACGVPVIVTDCDFGPREQVTHGVDGWIVPTADSASIANALDRLLPDQDLTARLAAAGRHRARDFDIEVIAKVYSEYLHGLGAAGQERVGLSRQ
jgi:glycosyltransferase involved in cell wall biosynthesis